MKHTFYLRSISRLFKFIVKLILKFKASFSLLNKSVEARFFTHSDIIS